MLVASAKIPIELELARRGIKLKRSSGELIGPCPRCGGTDRFGVSLRKQIFNCRGCGAAGDVIDLVQFLDGVSWGEAIKTLIGDEQRQQRQAIAVTSPPKAANDNDERKLFETAHRIWGETVAIAGTPGEAYFASRGITLSEAPNYGGLRWHPRCPWENGTTPCVIGRYTDAITGEARGIWRRPIDGRKPMTLGPMKGCVIRLWPDDDDRGPIPF
jgi:hypothetical protein